MYYKKNRQKYRLLTKQTIKSTTYVPMLLGLRILLI